MRFRQLILTLRFAVACLLAILITLAPPLKVPSHNLNKQMAADLDRPTSQAGVRSHGHSLDDADDGLIQFDRHTHSHSHTSTDHSHDAGMTAQGLTVRPARTSQDNGIGSDRLTLSDALWPPERPPRFV